MNNANIDSSSSHVSITSSVSSSDLSQLSSDSCSSSISIVSGDITLTQHRETNSSSKKPSSQKPKRKRRRRRKNKGSITPPKTLYSNFLEEGEQITEEESKQYVALDCEMVGVGPYNKSSVARVCLINWNEEVLLDTFVKVTNGEVTDYRTFVSGVTKEDLESDDAMEITECRELVLSLIKGKVLIGHALINDLSALRISHPWSHTRDTAKYEPFMKKVIDEETGVVTSMNPRKLKDLMQEKVGRTIQVEGEEHCPIEDAASALLLYKCARKKWEKVMEYKIQKTSQILSLQQ